VKLGIGQFLKHHWMKECVSFVTLRRLKMKTLSLRLFKPIHTLDLNFKICDNTNLPNLLTQQNYGDLGVKFQTPPSFKSH
jgi:hypothetical protein